MIAPRPAFRWFGRAAACTALLFACGCASSGPPNPFSQPQAPGDPLAVTDGDVTAAPVRGMQILVKRIPGAELVAGQLVILGGVRNWGKSDAGVEQLALSVSASGGTESLDKDAFTRRLATLGSMLSAGAGNDFSAFRAKSLRANWDATFELLVEAFLHPGLPPAEIELQRQQQLSALKHEQEDPDGLLSLISHQKLFTGHPYEN
ncbi:MAG TPA: insulinase family protein, partial [Myxococcaceae bacterium]|nr:insulinase family protein [Myxococcaceae bacterium]